MNKKRACIGCATMKRKGRMNRLRVSVNGQSFVYLCMACSLELERNQQRIVQLEQKRIEREERIAKGLSKARRRENARRRKDSVRKGFAFRSKSIQWRRSHVKFQGGRCAMCDEPFGEDRPATLDHIIPLSDGGLHSYENTQALCRACHDEKDNG